jgi:hypothetical protein
LTAHDSLLLAKLVCPEPAAVARAPVPDAPNPLRPTLLVAYVSSRLIETPSRRLEPAAIQLSDTTARDVTISRRGLTQIERWTAFDREFGVQHRSASAFKSALQSLKYGIDRTVFAVRQLEYTIEDAVNVEYAFGESAFISRQDTRQHHAADGPRLKSDFSFSSFKGEAYLGVRLVVPWVD